MWVLPFSSISQFVIIEIIIQTEDFSHSLGQDLRLELVIIVDSIYVTHDVMMIKLKSDRKSV